MERNERKLCQAVMRLLQGDEPEECESVRYPEDEKVPPLVDCRFRLRGRPYAIEHTIVEPFEGQIQASRDFEAFYVPIAAALDRTLPRPGSYELRFPIDPTNGLSRRRHASLQADIISWVRVAACELCAEMPRRPTSDSFPSRLLNHRAATIGGIPLVLCRRLYSTESGRHDGRLFPVRMIGEDLEALRLQRVERAVRKKTEQLKPCHEEGDETILLLEWSDFVLSNEQLIMSAAGKVLEQLSFVPDWLVIADTSLESEWAVRASSAVNAFSMAHVIEREFDPNRL